MIRRSFLLLMLLGCSFLLWQTKVWSVHLMRVWQAQQHAPNVEDVAVRHTYQLTSEWLRFPVSPRASKLRMLTAAVMRRPLPEVDYSEVRQGWRYSIEVELIDAKRQTVYREITHYRSNVSEYLLPGQTEFVTPSRFTDPALVPLSTRHFQLAMERFKNRILETRVRLVSADSQLDSVTVRCASIVQRIGYDDPDLWQQKSQEQKDRLCRAAIYPPELLSPEQRKNLLRWRTVPTPPLGLEGHDYQRVVMYSRTELKGIEVGREFTPEGIVVGAGKRRIVRLPDVPGTVRLTAESADLLTSIAGAPQRTVASVHWYDANNQLRQSRELVLKPAVEAEDVRPAKANVDVHSGWIEIIGDERVAVQLSWEDAAIKTFGTLTPERKSNKMYLCENEPLRFPIHHLADASTPLRLSARQLLRTADAGPTSKMAVGSREFEIEPASIRWQFLDENEQELRTGELMLTPTVSEFDMTDRPDPSEDVSDDVQLYFRVPGDAKQLVVEPVFGRSLVHVATRPIGIPMKKVVRDVLTSDVTATTLPVREWFPVRAKKHMQLAKHQRVVRVQIAPRPPRVDEQVVAGDYLWEDFRPRNEWSGRGLLIPTGPSMQVRDESLLALFTELTVNAESEVEIRSTSPYAVEVAFVVLGSRTHSQDTVITIDGDIHVVGERPSHCEIYRVSLLPGVHRIAITADPNVRVLVNNTRRPDANAMVKRMMGIELTSSGHTFCFRKASFEEELLLVDAFRLVGESSEPLKLTARLTSRAIPTTLEPLTSLSHSSLEFLLHPPRDGEPQGYVINTDEKITGGRRCYLWLGEDLPPGDHELHLATEAKGVFVVVSRTTPGEFSHRRVFRSE